ncbi:MAG: P-loop NTPase [Anaerolineae bacterium]
MSFDREAGPMGKIRVLVIPGMDPVGDWMADVIKLEQDMTGLGVVRDLSQALETVDKLAPEVILVDIGSGILQRTEILSRLAASSSGAAVIVVAMLGEVDMVRQAMLHGAQGFLLKPFSEAELLSSIRQAYELVLLRRAKMPKPEVPTRAESIRRSHIIAVFSPKGGVGCTTVAINLAVALKLLTDKPTILLDADLRFGDIDTALNISSATSVGTLVSQLDEMDNQLLDRSLIPHKSGVRVVVAPPHLDMADAIRPEHLKKLVERLAELDEGYVVIDAWSTLDDCTLSILDNCQQLIVITTPQVTAMRDVHRFLEVHELLGYSRAKIQLVLNHCYHRSQVDVKELERALGYAIVQEIEYTPNQVTASLNRGVPLVQEYENSAAAKSIMQLAERIIENGNAEGSEDAEDEQAETEDKPKRRGLFSQRRTA